MLGSCQSLPPRLPVQGQQPPPPPLAGPTQVGAGPPPPLMDMDASQTWPPPTPSPPPFSSRPHASPSPHRRRRRHSKKHKPPPAPTPQGADFSALPPELVHRALAAACASDVAAASRACRAWRDALRPLREAAALHAYGRRVKHGLVAGSSASRGAGGERLETERQRALGLFRRAARLGSAAAMVDAGLMCWEDGRREEAVGYYRSAADLGHPVGMCNLGVSYLEADPPKAEEAIRWFYPSASAGNARAQYNLGLCLQNGKGVKRNQKEAAKWYLRAAEGGNVRAMYNISLCYSYGEGLSQDPVRAKRWLQLAADCGHKKALYECGIKLCAAGDRVKSLMYLELATRRGETAAAHMRDVIFESLSVVNAQRAMSDADKWKPRTLHPRR
ncbi:F-box protein At1g70590-like [Miscanthus floridulus]|uniref:F-box protein At1g70590-like n=1 Tax=Miscanthus floridulus TaxID=154761 RepID=UPI003458F092